MCVCVKYVADGFEAKKPLRHSNGWSNLNSGGCNIYEDDTLSMC